MSKHFENKKLQLAIVLTMLVGISKAQTPYLPTAYPGGSQVSFVRTWDAVAPEQDPNALMTRPVKDVKQATQYLDGLGRPIQTIIKQGSLVNGGTATDVVSANVYDEFGREQYKFLPTVANNTGGNASINDGAFKLNPFQQQEAFYNSTNSPIKGQGETFFYSQTNFESSPLNRPTKSFAQGNSWVGTRGSSTVPERGVAQQFLINNTNDGVISWSINSPSITAIPSPTGGVGGGLYPAGELFKTVVTDEHNKQVVEFKDKEGKAILKKVQIANTVTDGHTGWLCTYYIYDDFNQLRFVLSPKATEAYLSGTSLAVIADELCFKYEYDQSGRKIKSKVPGAGEVWVVYDARDRVVLSQDATMRVAQKWMYTTYDALNRPVSTGLITDPANYNNHTYHLNNASASSSYPNVSNYINEELTRTFFDNYDWLYSYGNPLSNSYNSTYNTYFTTPSNSNWPYPQANVPTTQLKGVPTGTRIKVLGTANTYLYTVNFYDDKGRVLQNQSTNITGGIDIVTTQYTWAGQPLVMIQKQEKAGANPQNHVVVSKMLYDDLGRLSTISKTINSIINGVSVAKPEQIIVKNEFDALGKLKKKILSPSFGGGAGGGLENLTYDYNIRGWMLGTNREYAKDNSNNTNYFGFDLGYEKPNNGIIGNQTYANPQFNGNIEGMVWKSKGDGEKRKYDFTYDNANRLVKGDFTQYDGNSNSFNLSAGIDFSVGGNTATDGKMKYDANGNILELWQKGLKINASDWIDKLNYNYTTNSNKLLNVIDIQNDATTKLGDFRASTYYQTNLPVKTNTTVDYTYDNNGSLIKDLNKDIKSITYNHLNLPSIITVDNGTTGRNGQPVDKGIITYLYDAVGNKLQKITDNNIGGDAIQRTTTSYINGFVYQNDSLQFFPHEEGRIRYKPANGAIAASFQFDYMLLDHLHNTRMVLTEEVQQDVYPAATLETPLVGTESSLFYTIDQTKIISQSAIQGMQNITYPNNNGVVNNNASCGTGSLCTTDYSQKMYQLNSTTNQTGLGITLKVMAGDKLDIFGKSYYFQNNTSGSPANTSIPILNLLGGFLGGPTGANASANHGVIVTPGQINTPIGVQGIGTLFTNQTNQSNATPTKPKAFINYLFFDEQFKCTGSGFSQVGDNSSLKDHHTELQNLSVPKNGFVYIYCSNESPVNVFFDNIQVVHNRGAILEENTYYCGGLIMSGLSSRAAGKLENKKSKFNGYEYNTDFDINLYESFYRSHDPQLGGRFWQLDPKPTEMESPYAAMSNNPVLKFDILGDTSINGQKYENFVSGETLKPVIVKSWTFSKNVLDRIKTDANLETSGHFYLPGEYSSRVKDKIRFTKNSVAQSLKEMLLLSRYQREQISLGKRMVGLIKGDDNFKKFEEQALMHLRNGERSFTSPETILLGGDRGSLIGLVTPLPSSPKTWAATLNELTWSLRNVYITATLVSGNSPNGGISVKYHIEDYFDLKPGGRTTSYNIATTVLGKVYHDWGNNTGPHVTVDWQTNY